MKYKEIFNEIINVIAGRGGSLDPYAYTNNMNMMSGSVDYHKFMDVLNFLMSRCLLRLDIGSTDFGNVVTFTKLGETQLKDDMKLKSIFEIFTSLFEVDLED